LFLNRTVFLQIDLAVVCRNCEKPIGFFFTDHFSCGWNDFMPNRFHAMLLVATVAFTGCGLFKADKTAQLQIEKQQLVTRVQQEMQQKQQLEAANRDLNTRLAEAEKAVARLAISQGAGLAPNLQQLAAQTPGLTYDAQTHLARFESEIVFPAGQTQLDDSSRRLLDQMVALLGSPQANGSRVVIAGQSDITHGAARASAVASYLRERGLADHHFGGMALQNAAPQAAGTGRVALLLAEPTAPIISQLNHGLVR